MDNGAELSHQGEEAADAGHDDSGGASEAAAALACNCCRRRKLRCSREVPACQQCRKTGSDCVYESKRSKPGMKAGAIENLHRRLDALERTVHQQRTKSTSRDKRRSELNHSPNQDSANGTNGGLENSAYSIMAFFAKELHKFNSKNGSSLGEERAEIESLGRAKRRRLDDQEPINIAFTGGSSPGLPALPDEEDLEIVLKAYFAHIHPWITIIHEARFRRRLREPAEAKLVLAVLHAVVLSASRYISDEDIATSVFGSHQQRTMTRDWIVSTSMKTFNVESHQALIIVAFNDIGSGEVAQAWSLVGSLTRTVEYLQLTVEHDDADRSSLSQPFVSLAPPDSWTEAEERRRVFWNVFKLDRLISVTMGWNTRVTPYFGIWDKAAGRIGNPIAFIPSHYAPTLQTGAAEEEIHTPSDAGTSPGAPAASVDMSTVGAFVYCIEATESLSRVTSYFLQQRINMRDQRDISSWLTRFKELDLRLVHWKMLLPQKWKTNMARQSTRMDPNLTLAHVTHNTSMILLHQLIAFPPREWPFRARLPSILSADTCQAAAVEIAIIADNYLKHAPAAMPVSSQFVFCVYVAARVLLLRWSYDLGTELASEFWTLVQILNDMATRWAGPHSLEPARDNLAGKYSRKLTEMHSSCRDDASFNINVLSYTTEIDHTAPQEPLASPQIRRNGSGHGGTASKGRNKRFTDSQLEPPGSLNTIVVAQQLPPNNPASFSNPPQNTMLAPPGLGLNGVEPMAQTFSIQQKQHR
ncbi:hypothetical protein BDP81DRAFT_482866 [Colletotrichum phormii]|uniref:Zn(2)-C6 fungal-type domain-containing protein n=1 Tax=Colletotrichum phormii TaxID=359342 RepID=A0AAJ0EBM5_9PEZI|nr:uncharacterized protein BDP81DRAFT_482866 [Colletotrichum phormii]KAK1633802.1 hypothetical protein BDP81DRAFT_482866 [Colletotrichum phormii]